MFFLALFKKAEIEGFLVREFGFMNVKFCEKQFQINDIFEWGVRCEAKQYILKGQPEENLRECVRKYYYIQISKKMTVWL